MVLTLVIHKTDDGFTAEVPSLKGCETWAPDEDSVISKIVELAGYYLNLDPASFKLDKARGSKTKSVYKLVFDKEH